MEPDSLSPTFIRGMAGDVEIVEPGERGGRSSLLKPFYHQIYELFGENDVMISCVGSYVLMVVTYWTVCGLLLFVDITGRPLVIARYKVQQDKPAPVDSAKLYRAFKTVLFNNIVLNALSAYPMYRAQARAGCNFDPEMIPLWTIIIRDLVVFVLVQEVIFYYSHRLFHLPYIYSWVHRKHHQWTAPIGMVAINTTPLEYLAGNGLSVFLGPLLCRSHIVTWWIWFTLATTFTIIHHSGYHLPGFPSPQFHDYHHLTFNWNYGTLGVLDWMHGTDGPYRRSVQRRRHRTFWSFTPIHLLYPSMENKNNNNSEQPMKTAD